MDEIRTPKEIILNIIKKRKVKEKTIINLKRVKDLLDLFADFDYKNVK